MLNRVAGWFLILGGLAMAVFGSWWGDYMLELLSGSAVGAWLELLLPFSPIVIIASGAALYVRSRRP